MADPTEKGTSTGRRTEPELSQQQTHGTDSWLVERSRAGDQEAFAELVRRYERRVVKALYQLVGNLEIARDLAQETFLRVYRSLEKFDTSRRFGPWLFRVAVNLATDWMRRGRHLPANNLAHQRGVEPRRLSESPETEQWETVQEVRHVLALLPEKYRIVLVLRELQGLSTAEIAAITGRKEATIRWRLGQARQMFKELWERRNNG